MNNRRRFIQQTALAATAVLASSPFKSIAGVNNLINGYSNINKHLILVHTAEKELSMFDSTYGYIQDIKKNNSNTLIANTSKIKPSGLTYDFVYEEQNSSYSIITKAGITTGIIYAEAGNAVISNVNSLAGLLKNEKKCQLVVCVSQLGYKQPNEIDDRALAASSEHIDIIISGHATNFLPKTFVAANKNKHEVIIQASKLNEFSCGKIEIGFDADGRKNNIHIGKKLASQQNHFAA